MKKVFYLRFKSHLKASLFLSKIFFYKRFKRFHLSFFWIYMPTLSVLIGTLIASKQLNLNLYGFQVHYTLWVIPPFVIFRSITESIDAGQKLVQISFLVQKSLNVKNYQIFLSCIFTSISLLIFDILLAIGIIIYFSDSISVYQIVIYLIFFVYGILIGSTFSIFFGSLSMLLYDLRFFSKLLRVLILFCTPIFYIIPKSGIVEILNIYNPFTYLISASRGVIIDGVSENVYLVLTSLILVTLISIIFLYKFKFWIQIINSTLVKGVIGQTYAWFIVFKTKTKNDKR